MYQVWTKDEFEGWKRKDCEDLAAAQAELFAALKRGAEPLLTVEVPFDVNIKIKEVPTEEKKSAKERYAEGVKGVSKGDANEVSKGKTKPGKGSGTEGKGEV